MSLILRSVKGSQLTFNEMDGNFTYLEDLDQGKLTTSSFNAFTSSYNTGSFTGSFVGDGSGLTNIPGVSGSVLATGSFATTGSNTFVGSQTIGGNVFADNYKGYYSLVGTASSEVITFNVLSINKTSNHRYFGTGSAVGYHIDDVEAPFLTLLPGKTYRFDQSDASNNTHQLRFYYQADKTTLYTTNVTYNGTAGSAGAYTQIIITDTTPIVLHYQCVNHAYMGNSAQFNSNVIDTPYLINAKSGITVTGTVTATTFTGSFVGDGSGLTNIPGVSGSVLATGSFATTGSNTFVGNQIIDGTVTATTFTGSFVGNGSGLTGISIATGSFATTGSNIFNGSQIITGSLNINGSINATSAVTASAFLGDASYAASGRWTVGANGNSDYTFTGVGFLSTTNDPIFYFARGRVYEFVITSGGSHPFQIRVSNGGSAYNDGVTNNGATSGVIRFEIPFNAPNTLYYQCTNHSGMGNVINIYPSI